MIDLDVPMRPRGQMRTPQTPPLDEFCLQIARVIAGTEAIKVASVEGGQLVVIELTASSDDIGRLVGRDGRTIGAIRTLAEALAMRIGKKVIVDVQAAGRSRGA